MTFQNKINSLGQRKQRQQSGKLLESDKYVDEWGLRESPRSWVTPGNNQTANSRRLTEKRLTSNPSKKKKKITETFRICLYASM